MRRLSITFLLALLGGCASLGERGLEGDWQGEVETPLGEFLVLFEFRRGEEGLECTMQSPRQTVLKVPCGEISIDAERIEIPVPSVGGRYVGTIGNDEIDGQWTQTGMDFELDLARVD